MLPRLDIAISAIAALISVAVLLIVVVQIDRTRRALQADGVLEFNFVQQADHNLDEFAHALREQRIDGGPVDMALTIERYDVLYSLLSRSRTWIGSFASADGGAQTLEELQRFVLEIEPEMTPDTRLTPARNAEIAATALALSARIYQAGIQMFAEKSRLRDTIALTMDRLVQLFWFFGVLFLLAGMFLYLSLTRAVTRSAAHARDADSARLQLELALEELTSGDIARKSQNRFLAAATHDLRQPLQALQYYLAALDSHVTGASGRGILADVGRSTDAAQSMLTALLDVSKLDAGVLEARPEPVDLDALLAQLHADYRVEAEERGLTLSVETSGQWVRTDPQLLERIIRNLVSNALAYTPEGGIDVTLETREDTLMLSVSDTGIGIPERELEVIFNEYYQVRDDEKASVAGLGLGLSIVKRLTSLLGIPITVESRVGEGTRFGIVLPVTEPVAARPARAATSGKGSSVVAGLAIMVIDDDIAVRDGVTTMLRQEGCHVIAAASADDACGQLVDTATVPDLLLADHQLLGGRTGLDAIEQIRDEVNETVPAIMITGDTAAERLHESGELSMPLLHKPITADVLYATIATTLADADAASAPPARFGADA